MGEITELLSRSAQGDAAAMNAVFRCVYPELRRLASSQLGQRDQTLTPTVLVHETYLRLMGAASLPLSSRRHFFNCAARAMRNILIDHLRAASSEKRGGAAAPLPLDGLQIEAAGLSPDLLDLDAALDALDCVSARQREIVELHFFAGLGFAEISELLECPERTVFREWQRARAFLHAWLRSPDPA